MAVAAAAFVGQVADDGDQVGEMQEVMAVFAVGTTF